MGVNVLVLKPGESVLIPSNVTVQSIVLEDGATMSSTCSESIPTDEYVCVAFWFSDSHATGENDATLETLTIESIEIAGTVYNINLGVSNAVDVDDIILYINNIMGPVFVVYGVANEDFTERTDFVINARVPSLLLADLKFKITGTGFSSGGGAYVIPVDIEDCECSFMGDPDNSTCTIPVEA